MKIGIFLRANDDMVAAVIDREGLEVNIEGYVYDLNDSFKGKYYKNINQSFFQALLPYFVSGRNNFKNSFRCYFFSL